MDIKKLLPNIDLSGVPQEVLSSLNQHLSEMETPTYEDAYLSTIQMLANGYHMYSETSRYYNQGIINAEQNKDINEFKKHMANNLQIPEVDYGKSINELNENLKKLIHNQEHPFAAVIKGAHDNIVFGYNYAHEKVVKSRNNIKENVLKTIQLAKVNATGMAQDIKSAASSVALQGVQTSVSIYNNAVSIANKLGQDIKQKTKEAKENIQKDLNIVKTKIHELSQNVKSISDKTMNAIKTLGLQNK